MSSNETTVYDRFIGWCKNQPIIVGILIFSSVVVGLGAVIKSIQPLLPNDNQQNPNAKIVSVSDNNNRSAPAKEAYTLDIEEPIGPILMEGEPYPIGGSEFKIGMRLSVLKTLFPNNLSKPYLPTSYIVLRQIGPFDAVQYKMRDDQADPLIWSITFHFSADDLASMEQLVKRAAISAFGEKDMESLRLGGTLIWKDVRGLEIEVDENSYNISNVHLAIQ